MTDTTQALRRFNDHVRGCDRCEPLVSGRLCAEGDRLDAAVSDSAAASIRRQLDESNVRLVARRRPYDWDGQGDFGPPGEHERAAVRRPGRWPTGPH